MHAAHRLLSVLLAGHCATFRASMTTTKGAFDAGRTRSRQWYAEHCPARSMQRARGYALRHDGSCVHSFGPHSWQVGARDPRHVRQLSRALTASTSSGARRDVPSANFCAFFVIRFRRTRCSGAPFTSTRALRGRFVVDFRICIVISERYSASQMCPK